MQYAANDVLFLHLIYAYLLRMAIKEERIATVKRMNKIIPMAVMNYLEEFSTEELLAHH